MLGLAYVAYHKPLVQPFFRKIINRVAVLIAVYRMITCILCISFTDIPIVAAVSVVTVTGR